MDNLAQIIGVIICTTALFGAIIVCLAVPPKIVKRMLSTFACVTAFFALGFYGYGYAQKENCPFLVAVLRATFAVCRVFVGSNDWDAVGAAFTTSFSQVAFWLIHLMGLFTSASAIITSLGSGLIRKIRLWLNRKKDISVIYGLSQNSLEFGRELTERDDSLVLFVDQNSEHTLSFAVDQMGAVLRTDTDALQATVKFLKSIGIKRGTRKIWVYTLGRDYVSNQQYANSLLVSMKTLDISSEQTALTILGPSDETDNRFQTRSGQYGFGSVIAINEPEMVSRMLVRAYPPCEQVDFDQNGKALNDFHGLIIGFGHVGQEVLRQLVMHGQFYGNRFKVAVFSPNYEQTMGRLSRECSSMLEHYNIDFHAHDGRSCQLFEYIDQNKASLSYIAVCAGGNGINMEISEQLRSYLKRCGCTAPIYACSRTGIFHQVSDDKLEVHKIYVPEVLCSDQIDKMAMVLNHSYMKTGDMLENWRNCSYFNRMSSRAAADYHTAILKASGKTVEQIKKSWKPEGELLENLAAMEHLRWNAFHYCMGFRPMTDEEFEERAKEYRKQKEQDPDTDYRITRDMKKRIHACIIPWEKLNAYSAKENAVTGDNRNYAENDRDNIRALSELV